MNIAKENQLFILGLRHNCDNDINIMVKDIKIIFIQSKENEI